MVAQPTPQLITSTLPPSEAEQVSYFSVVYGTGREDLGKKAAFMVNRAQYLECARLRAERCPLFASVVIDEAKAEAHLPEEGVTAGVMQGAVEMQSIEHFAPNLSGPASRQAPFSKTDEADLEAEAQTEEQLKEDAVEDLDEEEGGGCFRAPAALIAEENANAEYLIGLEESLEDCAVVKLAAFRAKLRLLGEHSHKLTMAARRQAQAAEASDVQMDSAADTAAVASDHRSVCLDLRALAKRMGTSFQECRGPRGGSLEKDQQAPSQEHPLRRGLAVQGAAADRSTFSKSPLPWPRPRRT